MTKAQKKINSEDTSVSPRARRQPVYLIVADDTPEFEASLRYAACMAQLHNARIAVLFVLEQENSVFLPWGGVQSHMDEERRAQTNRFLERVAVQLNQYDIMPSFYIREGRAVDLVRDVVNTDPNVTKLILGADTNSASPGPLVSYFCGKGLSDLSVPVTVVPGHLTPDAIDRLAEMD